MKTVKVKVEQKHLDKGVPINATGCPVFLALREVFGGRLVSTGVYGFSLREPNERIGLSNKVANTISWMIRNGTCGVEPFSFEVEVEDVS